MPLVSSAEPQSGVLASAPYLKWRAVLVSSAILNCVTRNRMSETCSHLYPFLRYKYTCSRVNVSICPMAAQEFMTNLLPMSMPDNDDPPAFDE
jgi:hypothetical protein